MRIDHCKYVIAVAQSCNIRQSAEQFYITQQGLSQAIKAVERELDVQLFTRTGNSLYPTAEGRIIIERLQRIVDEYDSMMESVENLNRKDAIPESYTIYVTPNVANSVLSKIVTNVYREAVHPMLKIIEDLPLEITENLGKNPENCFGIISIPEFLLEQSEAVASGKVIFEEYARCPLMGYVSQSSPLAKLSCITSDIIRETPLAIFPSEINMVRHILDDETIEPNILINSSNMTLFRSLVAKHDVIGFTTTLFERNIRPQPITMIPLEKRVNILWGCVYSTQIPPSRWVKEIMMMSRATMQPTSPKSN